MYLFIYKTTHISGRYYIGRHQTDNLNDGYIGSGKWVTSIKDSSSVSREIIVEAKDFAELCQLEEHHIALHFNDPLCMNYIKGSNGWTSEDATASNQTRIKNGTHNFLGPENNLNRTNPFLGGKIQRESNRNRVSAGTHNFLGDNNPSRKRVKDGTHHWLGNSQQKRDQAQKQVTDGTHPFLGGEMQRASAYQRLENGTHPSQFIWHCSHCDKSGRGLGPFKQWHGDNCKSKS